MRKVSISWKFTIFLCNKSENATTNILNLYFEKSEVKQVIKWKFLRLFPIFRQILYKIDQIWFFMILLIWLILQVKGTLLGNLFNKMSYRNPYRKWLPVRCVASLMTKNITVFIWKVDTNYKKSNIIYTYTQSVNGWQTTYINEAMKSLRR